MAASEVEPIELPRYVAFRAWRTVPVIARIESRRSGRLWGHWFSRITPKGASQTGAPRRCRFCGEQW